MTYLHPSISSKIIDNSITFVASQGITQLFCAFTADVGPDNKITSITSPSEFLFHYGYPDMRKHGQAAYNAMNWLNSHGGLYALRVAADNAGYSHAIVNIQTKQGTKKVLDSKNVLVDMADVEVRNTIAYTSVNNTSESALEIEMSRTDHPDTLDGFSNNYLFAFYPKGRGAKYDNLGFRLTLTDSYDETYSFRLYNLEITKTDDSGATTIVDGPYLVSLDPDAVSSSNESMFIKYVVEKYSNYFNVIFNETAYDKLGTIFNSKVNPSVIDFFTGTTRTIEGKPETYYESITGKDEDVHIAIQKYNSSGVYTGNLNYSDPSNEVEIAMVDADDTLRSAYYASKLNAVEEMKIALNAFNEGSYPALVDTIAQITSTEGVNSLTSSNNTSFLYQAKSAFTTALTNFNVAETAYDGSSDKLTALENTANAVMNAISVLRTYCRTGLNYASTFGTSSNTLETLVDIKNLESAIKIYSTISIKGSSKVSNLINAKTLLGTASTGSNDEKLVAMSSALDVISDAYNYAIGVDSDDLTSAGLTADDASVISANLAIVDANEKYEKASDAHQVTSGIVANISSAMNSVSAAITAVETLINLAVLEAEVKAVKAGSTEIDAILQSTIDLLQESENAVIAADTADLKAILRTSCKYAIDSASDLSVSESANTYNLNLQDFNKIISFSAGSDGDLTYGTAGRDALINKLLVKAYKGLIDDQLLNSKQFPIDMVLDANYDVSVKNAIVSLCTEIRADFMCLLDTNYTANPQQAINFRSNSVQVSSYMLGIFTQDFLVYDDYTGQDIKVTSPYYLASKIPSNDEQYGINYTFVGPRRGTITGFKKLSWNPSEAWKEQLYKKQINYVEQDPRRTKFGSQLTAYTVVSALSDINNVRTLLRIKRDVEELSEDYQFEYGDSTTLSSFNYNLNSYLKRWISNRACTSISGNAYSSAYDKQQKIARVKVEIVFNNVIERIIIDLVVNKS